MFDAYAPADADGCACVVVGGGSSVGLVIVAFGVTVAFLCVAGDNDYRRGHVCVVVVRCCGCRVVVRVVVVRPVVTSDGVVVVAVVVVVAFVGGRCGVCIVVGVRG